MQASKLIEILQAQMAHYGDREVVVEMGLEGQNGMPSVESVSPVEGVTRWGLDAFILGIEWVS